MQLCTSTKLSGSNVDATFWTEKRVTEERGREREREKKGRNQRKHSAVRTEHSTEQASKLWKSCDKNDRRLQRKYTHGRSLYMHINYRCYTKLISCWKALLATLSHFPRYLLKIVQSYFVFRFLFFFFFIFYFILSLILTRIFPSLLCS